MKFKVGDIVRGVSNSPYAITDENMTKGEVVSVRRFSCGDDIQVKVLEHKTKPEAIGRQIFAKSKYFEPVCEHKLVVTEEGNKTLAWLCENDKIIRAAKIECSPKEAFERLMEKQNNLVSYLKDVIVGDFCGRIGTPTKMKDMA